MMEDDAGTDENLRKQIFIAACSFLGVPLMLFFGYLEYQHQNPVMAGLFMIGAVVLLSVYQIGRRGRMTATITRVALIYCFSIGLMQLAVDHSLTALYYLLLLPMLTVFVFGQREGAIWSGTMLLILFGLVFLPGNEIDFTDRNMIVDFTASYMIVLTFSLGYEALRQRAERETEHRQQSLLHEQQLLLQAQEELSNSEDRFRKFSNLASDWLYELDADYRIRYLSSRFEQISGVPAAELIGADIREVARAYQDNDEPSQIERLQQHLPFRDFRHTFPGRSGKPVHVMTRGEPQFDADGHFTGYMGSGTDVTAYEEFQAEIRAKDRTLHHVQKLDAIGQLTSGVAHDFNNLLTVIAGNLELLELMKSGDPEAISAIRQATQQAADLTAKLLAFARREPVVSESIDVDELLDQFVPLMRRSLGDGITLNVRRDVSLGACLADRSQLESALLNLSLNARDAMSGRGTITIAGSLAMQDQGKTLPIGNYVKLSITDEGEGMPPEIVDRVIEPFFTTKPTGEGTGLGLSMVYGFVTQSEGQLEIDSELGKGTTVTLYLPVDASTNAPLPAGRGEDYDGQEKLCILMVEDEQSVQNIVNRMLALMGHETHVYNAAEPALADLGEIAPDLLLTDIMLGTGMNGVQLADAVRDLSPATRVVLMSGYPEEALSHRNRTDDDYELIRKPFGFNDLQAVIAKVMRGATA